MIDFIFENQVARITMNRPDKRNALNLELLREFKNALAKAVDARVIVIRGAGKVFCAGMDLNELQDPINEQNFGRLLADVFTMIYEMQGITIAGVHGAVIAGGAGIMGACDVAIAAQGTHFGFPEVKRGLVPAQVITFLARQLRQRDLRELVLLGRDIYCDEARQIGLINYCVPYSILDEAIEEAISLAMAGAPQAIRETKILINKTHPTDFNKDMANGFDLHFKMRHTAEAKEGVKAFLEKRKPHWEKL